MMRITICLSITLWKVLNKDDLKVTMDGGELLKAENATKTNPKEAELVIGCFYLSSSSLFKVPNESESTPYLIVSI